VVAVPRRSITPKGDVRQWPAPFQEIACPGWSKSRPLSSSSRDSGRAWVLVANVFLGVSQGLTWPTTVIMKIDLAGPERRGLAMGLNEFASYVALGLIAWITGYVASVTVSARSRSTPDAHDETPGRPTSAAVHQRFGRSGSPGGPARFSRVTFRTSPVFGLITSPRSSAYSCPSRKPAM